MILIVSGKTACVKLKVRLSPLIYIRCPQYWGIEVIGELPGGTCFIGIVPTPFTVSMQLNGVNPPGLTGTRHLDALGAKEPPSPLALLGWRTT